MTRHTATRKALPLATIAHDGSEDVGLLTTKLCAPPVRPSLVPRARLIAKLDDGLRRDYRLTLVSAPAGYGKTTLLADWLHQNEKLKIENEASSANRNHSQFKVAWLALDQDDNDPARFWLYLISALQSVDANLGREARRLLAAPRRPLPRRVLCSLLNDLAACPKTVVLILDDYQAIGAAAIHKGMTFLADHAPPQLHLVLSSRVDPPLPLVRFRARDQLAELRMADLHFTLEETAAFLEALTGMRWWPEAVHALHGRTEGWIAGLQIAGLELQRLAPVVGIGEEIAQYIAGFSGHHSDIRDFLEQEVLSCQSQQVQAFLVLTSILDRLTGPLCDAVIGQKASQALLERLEKANVFLVPQDGARVWYRYHAMFADVLRDRLGQSPPDLVALLHRRAAEWYAAHGYAAEAADHRRRAEQLDHIGASAPLLEDRDLVATHAPPEAAVELGPASAVEHVLDESAALPPQSWEVRDHPLGKWWDQAAPMVARRPAGAPLFEQLTERELAVLRLIAEGLTYIQVSQRLVIGLNTVRYHVKNIYGKLNVHSRTQAIVRAKELRLLPR